MNRFAICQAFKQLESDYNIGGIILERPSSQRRRESISWQLHRMGYSSPYWWVDIEAASTEHDDPDDDEVRDIYMRHVLAWRLPVSDELLAAMRRMYVPEFLAGFGY